MVTIWRAAVIEESGSVLASFLKFFGCQLDPEKGLGIFPLPFFPSLKRKTEPAQNPVVFMQETAFLR